MLVAGIDVGAKNVHAVLIKDGDVVARAEVASGFDHDESAERGLREAVRLAGVTWEDIDSVAVTGAGRKALAYAAEKPTEIAADARGAFALFPEARTVVDVGADEARAIRLEPGGKVVDFAVNEKCAAGAGAFVEAMSRATEMSLEDFAEASLHSTETIPMNAQCTVFAESEVVSLIHANTPSTNIARAVHDAMASRVSAMVRRIGVEDPVVLGGGTALNVGFVNSLSEALGGVHIHVLPDPGFLGALGAGLIAWESAQNPERSQPDRPPRPQSSQRGTATARDGAVLADGLVERETAGERDFWRWSERSWFDGDFDPQEISVLTVGVDVGSVSSQAVILGDGRLLSYFSTRTGSSSPDSAVKAFRGASEPLGITLDDVSYAVGTGYGRVNVPFADRTLTEIACHARGANFMAGPSVRTILDMGGQDCKVIRCDERGKVLNFIMNDKCAAGTGRGMEVIADVLGVPVEDIGRRSFETDEEPPPVSNVCVVFAKSEATSLLRAGWSVNRVLAAYCAAMAQRVAGLIERMQVEREFFITGGIAKNIGVTRRIERLIGVEALKLPEDSMLDPQMAGALGAALFAHSLSRKAERERSTGVAAPRKATASDAKVTPAE